MWSILNFSYFCYVYSLLFRHNVSMFFSYLSMSGNSSLFCSIRDNRQLNRQISPVFRIVLNLVFWQTNICLSLILFFNFILNFAASPWSWACQPIARTPALIKRSWTPVTTKCCLTMGPQALPNLSPWSAVFRRSR